MSCFLVNLSCCPECRSVLPFSLPTLSSLASFAAMISSQHVDTRVFFVHQSGVSPTSFSHSEIDTIMV